MLLTPSETRLRLKVAARCVSPNASVYAFSQSDLEDLAAHFPTLRRHITQALVDSYERNFDDWVAVAGPGGGFDLPSFVADLRSGAYKVP